MHQSPDNSLRWLILADDRTGAADAAIPFAHRGLPTILGWHTENSPSAPSTIYSHDADCRHLPAEKAAATFRAALQTFLPGRTHLFQKIDSALRGQPAAEIAASLDFFRAHRGRAFAILAPAFPAMARTTQNAHVFLHGRPLEENPLWQRDHTYPNANLADMLQSANIPSKNVPLETIRHGPEALRNHLAQIQSHDTPIAICDALEQSDLEIIATAARAIDVPPMRQDAHATFFIGTAGLAHALAKTLPQHPLPPPPQIPDKRGALIVVGSFAPESRAAAATLRSSFPIFFSPLDIPFLLDASAAPARTRLAEALIEKLSASQDVLVEITADHPPEPALHAPLAAALAALLASLAPHISSLAATGGQTAAALFAAFHIHAIRLLQEIAPGIPLGISQGDISIPVITKAGAFGNDQSLLQILHRLRELRQIGCHP